MKSSPSAHSFMLAVACCAAVAPAFGIAVEQPGDPAQNAQTQPVAAGGQAFRSVADLEVSYGEQVAALERKKLSDLLALAQRLPGSEADHAYRTAFDLAVARGLYALAEPAARGYLARAAGEPENQALAESIVVIARADRGEYDQSLVDLKQFLEQRAAAQIPDQHRLPAPLICAVGEAYLHRLARDGRFDIAREVCRLAAQTNHPDKTVQNHFAQRLARFELIGKVAPAIEGIDVDGRPVKLADLKGKVVLVDFWATWCPPCVVRFPHVRDMLLAHRAQGFAVLGVNLDALSQDLMGKTVEPKEALATVRWFLLHHRASWPTLIGPGAETAAKDYGVSAIPATFLIGRDGTISHVEQSGADLAKAIEADLKQPPAAGG